MRLLFFLKEKKKYRVLIRALQSCFHTFLSKTKEHIKFLRLNSNWSILLVGQIKYLVFVNTLRSFKFLTLTTITFLLRAVRAMNESMRQSRTPRDQSEERKEGNASDSPHALVSLS